MRKGDVEERVKILKDGVLSMTAIDQIFLQRAQKERISDKQAIKLLNYLNSWDSFKELESFWFWYYDPRNLKQWYKILDHIYKRSITATYLMN